MRSFIITSGQCNLTTGRIAAAHGRYSLYDGPPPPLKIAPFHGRSGPHPMHSSLGQPESTNQRASRSIQLFCREHDRARQTYRQTDRQITLLRL